jgi:NAD(P)-dependent dehydrogenase (short-subunit alcohol dehydrogenase family)
MAEVMPVLEELTLSLDLLVIAPAEPGAHERLVDATRDEALHSMSGTGLTENFRRHAVAPILLVRTLLPLLARGDRARILLVSSWLGSLAGKTQGGDYARCGSAAALHMMARALAHDLADDGITVCIGNPGNFNTTPDGPSFLVPIADAATGLLSVTDRLKREQSGGFYDWTGSERAW